MDWLWMVGKTQAEIAAVNEQFAKLSAAQISTIFAKAGMGSAAQRNGNVYNQLRAGSIDSVVGTLKAGCSARSHKDARRKLRKALREEGVSI